jgi:phospholipid/cholesterol/gamma-HCH transport system permease protein
MVRVLAHLGGMARLTTRIVARALRGQCARHELTRALWAYGNASLPIASLTAMFSGAIMVMQAGVYIRQYGVYNLVGWFAGFSTLREMAPVLIGFIFSGRVGSHHTSELASMVVGDKLDALRLLNVDVTTLWIVPRVLAMTVAMVALVTLGDAVALLAGASCARLLMGLSFQSFFTSLASFIHVADFGIGVLKGGLFGATVGLVSSYFGLRAEHGAAGVGHAVHAQVVASALGLVCVDYGVTMVWS